MAVKEGTDRKAKWITWDASASDSESVTLRLKRPDGTNVSTTNPMPNDGIGGSISYPIDHHGTTVVEVLDEHGEVIDSGEITV